jgi:hypothetical protein
MRIGDPESPLFKLWSRRLLGLDVLRFGKCAAQGALLKAGLVYLGANPRIDNDGFCEVSRESRAPLKAEEARHIVEMLS